MASGNYCLFVYGKSVLSVESLNKMLEEYINDASFILKKDIKCNFEFKILADKNLIPYDNCNLWLNNSEIYYLLQDLNPDGSRRVEYISSEELPENFIEEELMKDDLRNSLKDSTSEEEIQERINEMVKSFDSIRSSSSWAEDSDEMEEVNLPPLLPSIVYTLKTKEERNMLAEQIDCKAKYKVDRSKIDYEKEFKLTFVPIDNSKVKTDYFTLVGVPLGKNTYTFTEEEIKREMKNYVTFEADTIRVEGVEFKVTYPHVVMDGQKVFIRFSRASQDAATAFFMKKRCEIKEEKRTKVLMLREGNIEDVKEMEKIMLSRPRSVGKPYVKNEVRTPPRSKDLGRSVDFTSGRSKDLGRPGNFTPKQGWKKTNGTRNPYGMLSN